MVIANNLTVILNGHVLLTNVSCTLEPGRITSFIGRSGAGKTTLLKTLSGLVAASDGTITINGKQLSALSSKERSQTIGYVFQDFNLFPHLTAIENCIDPQLVQGILLQNAIERANVLFAELGMTQLANKYPQELSGGQQQRVAIVRALCLQPKVLLLDEPTASLDPENTDILVGILQKLAQQGMTIGLSSQDMNFIRKIVDRVYYLEAGTITEYCPNKEALKDCPRSTQFIE